MDESLVQKKSFEFALSTIRLYKKLQAREEVILSSQLLKSGTGIGVNVEEALAGWDQTVRQSLLTAAKEARETRYWLKLLQESRLADVDVSAELRQIDELIYLLGSLTSAGTFKIDAGDTSPLGEL
ncbi:MAG: four helix bundle protein [Pegethrix bostrychoides GSE-TBD4-15B]|jgi:four helix bundle protein|uniref:Four helix bundle protein n=1 Tax=Pegethrix bostrychoides GSE-TBD4-15B TaxID=2839662 RepID=A0A951U6P2_9CYAN|nr:four helix bundle protein [Pegethrix bostrychoides GSE-TBD4-15B]